MNARTSWGILAYRMSEYQAQQKTMRERKNRARLRKLHRDVSTMVQKTVHERTDARLRELAEEWSHDD